MLNEQIEQIAKATGYNALAFAAIEANKILEAYELAPGAFEFCNDAPMGIEYQFSNEVIPYIDKTVEWNENSQRFEGVFWGILEHEGLELRGWVSVDASDSTAYEPFSFEIQAIDNQDENEIDHPLVGTNHGRGGVLDLDQIEYDIYG